MKFPFGDYRLPDCCEADGLALSSRNARLSADERKMLLKFHRLYLKVVALQHRIQWLKRRFVEETIAGSGITSGILRTGGWQHVAKDRQLGRCASYVVGKCNTVFCGEVRLIDNIKYKE